ncbi:hypothetical protein BJX61DRAFT_540350 [Aspergillus egyptiacus]|nr:hypothetical protein BJX61DRAFT_540350 [Aspergillus egyptiacus]
METTGMQSQYQPPQPPKSSTYTQPTNPVSQTPSEATEGHKEQRHQGDPTPRITRGASSKPSTSGHQTQQKTMQRHGDVDTEYGVEQQPNEGSIAHAVEGKSQQSRQRVQAGAHAGAVGAAQGPGAPGYGYGEGPDQLADLNRKTEEHERLLGEKVGRTPPGPEGEVAERERLRERKLQEDRELRPKDVVAEATGAPAVGR